jgi:hypothetical protein
MLGVSWYFNEQLAMDKTLAAEFSTLDVGVLVLSIQLHS